MATLAVYEAELPFLTLDGSNNVLTWHDQTSNAYDLSEGTSTNGGVWSAGSLGGWGSILQDGTNDYLFTSSGLANAAIGGTDNACWLGLAQQRVAIGTGGDCAIACGNSASANFFFRFVEGTAGVTEVRKRDDATAAGAGSGQTGTAWNDLRQYWEWSHPGTTTALLRTGTTGGLTTYIASTAMDVGACTSNRFAIGCLLRTSAASFMNQRIGAVHVLDAVPTSTELGLLRSWFARYVSPPAVLNKADAVRRDRHLHATRRPTTWKVTKNGVWVPAEDRKVFQVNGLRPDDGGDDWASGGSDSAGPGAPAVAA